MESPLHLYEKLVELFVKIYFCVAYSVSLIYVVVFLPISNSLDYCGYIVNLNIKEICFFLAMLHSKMYLWQVFDLWIKFSIKLPLQ